MLFLGLSPTIQPHLILHMTRALEIIKGRILCLGRAPSLYAGRGAIKSLSKTSSLGCEPQVTQRTQGGLLFLTVKPADAFFVLEEVRGSLASVALLVSACVGVPHAKLSQMRLGVPVARIMPNVLCAIGEGATAYYKSSFLDDETTALLLRALQAFGPAHAIPEELFDAYSAISGSSNYHSKPKW